MAVNTIFFIYYSFIPMDRLPTFYNIAHSFRNKSEEYDWDGTIRRERIYNLTSVVYLASFFVLSRIFGKGVAIFEY